MPNRVRASPLGEVKTALAVGDCGVGLINSSSNRVVCCQSGQMRHLSPLPLQAHAWLCTELQMFHEKIGHFLRARTGVIEESSNARSRSENRPSDGNFRNSVAICSRSRN